MLVVAGGADIRADSSGGPGCDTWTYGGQWKDVQDVGPGPRLGMNVIYDPDRKVTVLFGGQNAPTEAVTIARSKNDTWEWDGSHWRQVQDMGPGVRQDAGAAYDPQRKRIVLFGGIEKGTPEALRDTWEYFDHG